MDTSSSLARRLAVAVGVIGAALLVAVMLPPNAQAAATSWAPPLSTALARPSPSVSPAPTAEPSSTRGPTPSPNPSTQTGLPPVSGQGGCGFFDVTCRVEHAMNAWFADLVKAAINPAFGMLGQSLLATPRLDQGSQVRSLWTGSMVIANTCFVLFVMVGGVTLMGRETLQSSYAVKDIAPRLVVGMVAANLSLLAVGGAIGLANALSAALLGPGLDPTQAANTLSTAVSHAVFESVDLNIFITIVAIFAVVLGLGLTLIYVVRIMLTILLIAAAPLMAVCHALPQTEGIAKLWWRSIIGVLAIQVAQALVFVVAIRVYFQPDVVPTMGVRTSSGQLNLWITICLLYILIRIPFWISRLVWQGGVSRSPIMHAARTIAAIVVFRKLLPGITGSRSAAGRSTRRMIAPAGRHVVSPPGASPVRAPSPAGVGGRARWAQPQLPLGWPAQHGTQLQLPVGLATSQAQPPRPRHVQLRLPGTPAVPPRWQQLSIPVPNQAQQLQLPIPASPGNVQLPLPIAVPPRGTPAAGIPGRAQRLGAQRHAAELEVRARERRVREQIIRQRQQREAAPGRGSDRRFGRGGGSR